MDIKEIKKKAQEQLAELEEDEYVSKYRELLELKNSTVKQLKSVEKAIVKFEADPEAYVDENEELW